MTNGACIPFVRPAENGQTWMLMLGRAASPMSLLIWAGMTSGAPRWPWQRERSFKHDRKSVANDFALKIEHDKKGGLVHRPQAGRRRRQRVARALDRPAPGRRNSREVYKTVPATHINPAIGDAAIRRLTRSMSRICSWRLR
jgi:hypothetical protein